MAATVKGTANANAGNSVTIPTHAIGDLIVLFAYRDGSTTQPSKPSAAGTVPAWNDIQSGTGANTNSERSAYFVATATNHTSGTWTNATGMIAVVIQGHASSPIGGSARGGSTASNSATAPSITQQQTNGKALILEFYGHRTVTAWSSAPSGYTRQASVATEVCFNTKDSSTTDGSIAQPATTSSSSGYRAQTIEILGAETSPSVVLDSPSDAADITDTTPQLLMTGTDAEGDDIRYNVQIFDADPSVLLVDDNFNRADGSLGANWDSAGDAPFVISSNQARASADFLDFYSFWDGTFSPSGADYTVEADVQMNAASQYADVDLIARWQDANNYYGMQMWTFGGEIVLYKAVGGVFTDLDTSSESLPRNTWRNLKLVVNGTSIEGYLDDVLVVSATDSDLSSAGVPGMYATGHVDAAILVDNFMAYEAEVTPIIDATSAITADINKQVVSGADDAEETVDGTFDPVGTVWNDSSDIEIGSDGGTDEQIVGIRFTDLQIPQGATINSALVRFIVDVSQSGTFTIDIYGQDADTTSAFTSGSNDFNISSRTLTTATVNWNVGGSGATENTAVDTADISSIIQEIVDRPGWTAGNSIVIIFKDPSNSNFREFESYDGESGDAARLILNYTDAGVGFVNEDDGGDSSPFTSGDQVSYTVQSALSLDTYYWRARGRDPSGSNAWGDWSTVRSFNLVAPSASDIKSLSGVAQASLKSVAGVAIASVKSIGGVSNT